MSPEARAMQRTCALEKAMAVRRQRRELREAVLARTVTVVELLREPPPVIEHMPVMTLLTWHPGMGKSKARKLLRRMPNPTVELAKLSRERREGIVDELLGRSGPTAA